MKHVLALFSLVALLSDAHSSAQFFGTGPFYASTLKSPGGGGGACASNQTTNSWDELLEGFETASTGYEASGWTEFGTTANISHAADSSALATGKPDGACSKAWKLVVPTDGTATGARWDRGSTIDLDTVQTDVWFSFYVETAPDSGEGFFIWEYTGLSSPENFGLQLRNNGGTLQVITVAGGGSDAINILTDRWYVGKISFDVAAAADGTTFTLWSNGSVVGTDSFTRHSAVDLRYIYIGATSFLEAGDSGTVWFDLLQVKTN